MGPFAILLITGNDYEILWSACSNV